jgi:exonuclease SbcD
LDARPFVTLRADLRKSDSPTQDAVDVIEKHALKGAVVRMFMQLTPETEIGLNENVIHDCLRQSGASFIATVKKEVEQPARARLGGNPEGLSDEELMERYLISKQVDDDRRAELMGAAKDVFDSIVIRQE